MNYERFQPTINNTKKSIYLVDMTKELNYHFSQLAEKGISKYIRQGKKIGILVNKKGFATGILCHKCGHVPQCTKCSVSIGFHKTVSSDMIGLCHICKTQYPLPRTCENCKSNEIRDFGLGTQKVAQYIKNEYHTDPLIIESEMVNSPRKIEKLLDKVPHHQVFIGTSLLTTPIASQPFDLVVMLNADLGLNIPDFTAAEKNFWFLYEAFTKHPTTNFVVQTFDPTQYSIRTACKGSIDEFHEQDNAFRKEHYYPPYSQLAIILYKHEIEQRLFTQVDKLHKELLFLKEKYEMPDLEIYPTPPLVYKMFGKYRYNIILKGTNLRQFMDIVYTRLRLAQRGFKIDRNAGSIV